MSGPPAQTLVVNFAGPAFIGILLSTFFAGIIVVQAYDYYTLYSDAVTLKVLVGVVVVLTLVETGANIDTLWEVLVLNFGNMNALATGMPTFTSTLLRQFIAPVTQLLSQSFFAWRCWNMGHNYVFLAFVVVFLLLSFGSGTSVGVLLTATSIKDTNDLNALSPSRIATEIAAWSSAATDLTMFVYFAFKMRSVKSDFNRTNQIIRHLIKLNIETTLFTALVASSGAIALRVGQVGETCGVLFTFLLTRSYVMNLLAVLNSRQKLRLELQKSEDNAGGGGVQGWSWTQSKSTRPQVNPAQIEIHLDTIVREEQGEKAVGQMQSSSHADVESNRGALRHS